MEDEVKPYVGMTVVIVTRSNASSESNGHNDQPGIITKMWGPECVNVKVLPDCGEPFDATSQVFLPNGPEPNSQLSNHCWPAG